VEHVTPEMWKNVVEHVKKVEEEYWGIENVTDSVMDEQPEGECHVLMIRTGDTSSSDSDSDWFLYYFDFLIFFVTAFILNSLLKCRIFPE